MRFATAPDLKKKIQKVDNPIMDLKLNNPGKPVQEDIFLNGVEIYYPVGSHHFAIFHLTDTAIERGLLEIGAIPGIGVDPNDTFRIFYIAYIGTLGISG